MTCNFHDPSYFVSIINILHILQGVCKLMSTTVFLFNAMSASYAIFMAKTSQNIQV